MNEELLPREGLIVCAVSGGVDSMYLICRLRDLGYAVAAAHYNHGLRGAESDRDEEFVAEFCREREIPFLSEKGDAAAYARENRMGVEEAARVLRYDFLERAADRLNAAAIATAHTADDNAETILMHLIRGAGLRGLGGIPPRRGRILRPMLGVTRAEAEEYLRKNEIPHVEDSSNQGDAYLRNRLRHTVMPALLRENPALLSAMDRMAGLLREDEACLESLAVDFLKGQKTECQISAAELLALPRPVARRAVRLLTGQITAEQTDAVLYAAENGGEADVSGGKVICWRDRLYFDPRERAPLPDRLLGPGETVAIPEAGLSVRCEKIPTFPAFIHRPFNIFIFQCENICDSISVTARRPGDRYRPAGRGCTKTLKSIFEEMDVPPWERGSVPVLRDGRGVLAVYGAAPGERAAAGPGDRDLIRIEFIRSNPDGEG